VDAQAGEIESLKTDKTILEDSLNSLQGEHEKAVTENKILKRAVTIQQERQNQASSELGAARQFKVDAEERIRKLEHLVFSLRYHLQAQQVNTPGNDFMGFPPPNVY
jgi:chromosome segregation ATPase